MPTSPLLSVDETAAYLNVKPTLVRRLIREGELPITRVGARVLVHEVILEQFIAQNTNGVTR